MSLVAHYPIMKLTFQRHRLLKFYFRAIDIFNKSHACNILELKVFIKKNEKSPCYHTITEVIMLIHTHFFFSHFFQVFSV